MSTPGPSGRRRIAGERSRVGSRPPDPKDQPDQAQREGREKRRPSVRTPTLKTRPAVRERPLKPGRPRGGPAMAGLRPPRQALRWLVPLAALTVLAVAFAVVMGVRGASDYRQAAGAENARDVAAADAGKAAETIFSFQYDALDKHLARSKALMTDSFSKEFEKIAPALTELAPQRKIDVKATARNAAVEECGESCTPDKATVLVFFDQSRTIPGSKLPTVFGQRVEITMTKAGGEWLVDDIKAL